MPNLVPINNESYPNVPWAGLLGGVRKYFHRLYAIANSHGNAALPRAIRPQIWRSSDQGNTWTALPVEPTLPDSEWMNGNWTYYWDPKTWVHNSSVIAFMTATFKVVFFHCDTETWDAPICSNWSSLSANTSMGRICTKFFSGTDEIDRVYFSSVDGNMRLAYANDNPSTGSPDGVWDLADYLILTIPGGTTGARIDYFDTLFGYSAFFVIYSVTAGAGRAYYFIGIQGGGGTYSPYGNTVLTSGTGTIGNTLFGLDNNVYVAMTASPLPSPTVDAWVGLWNDPPITNPPYSNLNWVHEVIHDYGTSGTTAATSPFIMWSGGVKYAFWVELTGTSRKVVYSTRDDGYYVPIDELTDGTSYHPPPAVTYPWTAPQVLLDLSTTHPVPPLTDTGLGYWNVTGITAIAYEYGTMAIAVAISIQTGLADGSTGNMAYYLAMLPSPFLNLKVLPINYERGPTAPIETSPEQFHDFFQGAMAYGSNLYALAMQPYLASAGVTPPQQPAIFWRSSDGGKTWVKLTAESHLTTTDWSQWIWTWTGNIATFMVQSGKLVDFNITTESWGTPYAANWTAEPTASNVNNAICRLSDGRIRLFYYSRITNDLRWSVANTSGSGLWDSTANAIVAVIYGPIYDAQIGTIHVGPDDRVHIGFLTQFSFGSNGYPRYFNLSSTGVVSTVQDMLDGVGPMLAAPDNKLYINNGTKITIGSNWVTPVFTVENMYIYDGVTGSSGAVENQFFLWLSGALYTFYIRYADPLDSGNLANKNNTYIHYSYRVASATTKQKFVPPIVLLDTVYNYPHPPIYGQLANWEVVGLSGGLVAAGPLGVGLVSTFYAFHFGDNTPGYMEHYIAYTPKSLTCPASSVCNVGIPYGDTLTLTGGTPGYYYTITSGALPPGLTLNSSTGAITGTPTTAGTYTFTVSVEDTSGPVYPTLIPVNNEPNPQVPWGNTGGVLGSNYGQAFCYFAGPMAYSGNLYVLAERTLSGGESGEIWKSTDGGNTWSLLALESSLSSSDWTNYVPCWADGQIVLTFLTNYAKLVDFNLATETWGAPYGLTWGASIAFDGQAMLNRLSDGRIIVFYFDLAGNFCYSLCAAAGAWITTGNILITAGSFSGSISLRKVITTCVDSTDRSHVVIGSQAPSGPANTSYYQYLNVLPTGIATAPFLLPTTPPYGMLSNIFAAPDGNLYLGVFGPSSTANTSELWIGTPLTAPVWTRHVLKDYLSTSYNYPINGWITWAAGNLYFFWFVYYQIYSPNIIAIESSTSISYNGEFIDYRTTVPPSIFNNAGTPYAAWNVLGISIAAAPTGMASVGDYGSLNVGIVNNVQVGGAQTGNIAFYLQGQTLAFAGATSCTITVTGTTSVPTISCPMPTPLTVGTPYSGNLSASGGVPPYTFSIVSGYLPPGLNLNTSTGVISGTPTTAGTYSYSARVTDSIGQTATVSCSYTVTSSTALPPINTARPCS